MKKVFVLTAILLGAVAVSCQKNAEYDYSIQPTMRTVTCTINDVAEPGTKVAINSATGKTEWEVGDEILFHGKNAGGKYSTTVILTADNISADKKTITVDIPAYTSEADEAKWNSYGYDCNIIAAYPASAVATDGGSTNWYGVNKYNTTNQPLMAGFNDGYDSNHIIFYNLCSIISFKVIGSFDGYILQGKTGETVGYSGYQSRIFKKKSDSSIVTEWVNSGSPLTSIEGTVVSDGSTENLIYLPNGANFTSGFTILLKEGSSVTKQVVVKAPVDLRRNEETNKCKFLALGDVTSYLKTYTPPATHNSSIPIAGSTALDASGNANCYIVDSSNAENEGKVFTFKAYKGNSDTGVGVVASADIIWETWNNSSTVTKNSVVADVDFEKKDGVDYYTMVLQMPATLHAGNALIAAKDAGGNILWSWHIWVPATTIESNTYGIAERAIMDRYLGALTIATEWATADDADAGSLGMLYQWGRKDPFPNVYNAGDRSPAKVAGTQFSFGNTKMSMADAIANPTQINALKDDWNTESSDDLWGYVSQVKTIYDPCPIGYKVPRREDIATIVNNTLSSLATWSCGAPVSGASTSFTWFKLGSPSTVFPNFGLYNYDASYGRAYRSLIWSSKQEDAAQGKGKYIYEGPGFGSTARKSQGGSIRCIVE